MALDTLQTRFARLLAEFTSSQQTMKQRISRIEKQPAEEENAENAPVVAVTSPNSKRKSTLLDVPSRWRNMVTQHLDIAAHRFYLEAKENPTETIAIRQN